MRSLKNIRRLSTSGCGRSAGTDRICCVVGHGNDDGAIFALRQGELNHWWQTLGGERRLASGCPDDQIAYQFI